MKKAEGTETTKPKFDVRLKGVRIAVWQNQSDDGRRFFSATPSRMFRDAGNEAKYTSSGFSAADLVLLKECATRALEFMAAQQDLNEEE
jgi:hypothetical protein